MMVVVAGTDVSGAADSDPTEEIEARALFFLRSASG
jgi:hypothetical protein